MSSLSGKQIQVTSRCLFAGQCLMALDGNSEVEVRTTSAQKTLTHPECRNNIQYTKLLNVIESHTKSIVK